jgi:hypothetical protein
MTALHYTPDLIAKFLDILADIQEIDREFRQKKAMMLSEVVDRYVFACTVCDRLMIPRKLWYSMEAHERPSWLSAVGDSKKKLCLAHKQPNRYRPKTTETIRKLQQQVGFNPSKDYDAEDEASA